MRRTENGRYLAKPAGFEAISFSAVQYKKREHPIGCPFVFTNNIIEFDLRKFTGLREMVQAISLRKSETGKLTAPLLPRC